MLLLSMAVTCGCVGRVTVNANATTHVHESSGEGASPNASGETRADFRVRMRVAGATDEVSDGEPEEPSDGESSASGGLATALGPDRVGAGRCPGVTIDRAGHTRSGRALGMGLLQVYARPGAELLVDETLRGRTPLTAVGADAGPRDLRLRNRALGYDCTFRLRVLPGERYSILLDVKEPPSPRVFTER